MSKSHHRLSSAFYRSLAILALMLCALVVSAAGVYKWTDANGKVHFSDKPPPDVEAETVQTNTTSDPHTAERLNQFKKQADENLDKRAQSKATALEEREKVEEMATHCNEVRAQLRNLETSTRRQFINEQGVREYVGEERRQEWMNTARAEIAKNCK